jgi:hypothetical protein
MGPLRDQLADLLGKHLICECGDWADDMEETCGHLADVLLAQRGITVVKLPEPDPDIGNYFDAGCGAIAHVKDGRVRLHSVVTRTDGSVYRSPAEARQLAAALFAAAVAAEEPT